ncbi:MAG: hypothetical protein KTR26_01045 [Flammeovirgaceae bacterium]|nr:hypothetical protein [Flammeovirgaceae bacterium]
MREELDFDLGNSILTRIVEIIYGKIGWAVTTGSLEQNLPFAAETFYFRQLQI